MSDTRELRPRDPDAGDRRHEQQYLEQQIDYFGHDRVTEAADAGDRAAADSDIGAQKWVGPGRWGQRKVQAEDAEA